MKSKIYFRLRFTLESPLSVGASNSENSDKDIVLDSRGNPIIPATSIAGVFRSLAGEGAEKLFGDIMRFEDGKKVSKNHKTTLIIYDAQLNKDTYKTVRDSVALNEFNTAKKGAKFDFEAVETGAEFVGYVEATDEKAAEAFEDLLQEKAYFGSKTTRGYGCVKIEYEKIEFKREQLDEWLEFDMFDDSGWNDAWEIPKKTSKGDTIKLSLKQKGGLSIRQYSTVPDKADVIPLALHDNKERPTPVIPGTSWAGIFRSHMARLLGYEPDGDEMGEVFGFISEESKSSAKSRIVFSESKLNNCTRKQLTRNAIDRFTNGTKDGALFTEITVYNGDCELEITLRKPRSDDGEVPETMKSALAATIKDLHNGYVAVGGLTSIGRGLFEIETVNGKEYDNNWNLEELQGVMFA